MYRNIRIKRHIASIEQLETRLVLFANGSGGSLIFSAAQASIHEHISRDGLSFPDTNHDTSDSLAFVSDAFDAKRFDYSFLNDVTQEEVYDGNVIEDTGFSTTLPLLNINHPELHFDASYFEESVNKINSNYIDAVKNADPANFHPGIVAIDFGKALHTIQDFYAHTNWVNYPELQGSLVENGLGLWQLNAPAGFKFLEGPDAPGTTAIRPFPFIPNDYRVGVIDDKTGDLLDFGIVSGGFSGNNKSPEGASITHDQLNHDYPGRPLFDQARSVAIAQTQHEFQRLGAMIYNAYGVKALNELMCAWQSSDTKTNPQTAFQTLWGHDVVGCATDLVLVIDTTSSMTPYIDAVKTAATQIGDQLLKDQPNSRIGVVLYKDYGMGDPYVSKTLLPFTNDISKFSSEVNSITVSGGGDIPEAVYSGLVNAIDNQQGLGDWRGEGVAKQIIFFGDAPPHDPEPGTGYTLDSVTAEAKAGGITISSGLPSLAATATASPAVDNDPITISGIALGSSSATISSFQKIAEANGGQLYRSATSSTFVSTLLSAIDQATADNQAPVITPIDSITVDNGKTTSFTVHATDPDMTPGGLSYSLDPESPPGATINSKTGEFSWTPTSGPAFVPITIHVSDNGSPPRDATTTVNINVVHVEPFVLLGPDTTADSHRTFGQNGSFIDLDPETWTATVDYGDGTGILPLPLNPDKTFNLAHTFPHSGSFTVTADVTDSSGQTGTDSLVVSVPNTPPVVVAGNDVSITSTQPLSAVGSFTDPDTDTWIAAVDYGDGSGSQPLKLNSDKSFSLAHAYSHPGDYTVTAAVRDSQDALGIDMLVVHIVNTAPTVTLGADSGLTLGQEFDRTGSFADPDADTWVAAVDFGDGTGVQSLPLNPDKSFSLHHLYSQAGIYAVTVAVTDGNKATGMARINVGVVSSNASPSLAAISDQSISEGSPLAIQAIATDTDAGQTITYSLDPGSPAGAAIDPKTGLFSFTPADGPASYRVTVRATDSGTPSLSDARTFAILVSNVAPTVDSISNSVITAGSGLNLASFFTDPGSSDTFTATVNYGDGTGDQPLPLSADRTFTLSHLYASAGNFIAAVTVVDKDGGMSVGSFTVTVTPQTVVAPPPPTPIDLGRAALITQLYHDVLKRAPDEPGMFIMLARLSAGTSVEALTQSFFESAEYRNLKQHHNAPRISQSTALKNALIAGRSTAFTATLYNELLGRQADSQGARFWDTKLAKGVAPKKVVAAFEESTEHRTAVQLSLVTQIPATTALTDSLQNTMLVVTTKKSHPLGPTTLFAR